MAHTHILNLKGSLAHKQGNASSLTHISAFWRTIQISLHGPKFPSSACQTPAESSQILLFSQSTIFPRESPRLGRCRITSVLIVSIPLTTAIQCSHFKSLALGGLLAVTFALRRLCFSRPIYFRCMLSLVPLLSILHDGSQFLCWNDVGWNRHKKASVPCWDVIDTHRTRSSNLKHTTEDHAVKISSLLRDTYISYTCLAMK